MTFNPEKHLMELQGKAYLEVQWRLVWFNEACPEGKITILEKVIDPDREITKEIPTGKWIDNPNRPGKKLPEKVHMTKRGWAYFHVRAEDGKGKVGEAVKSECAIDFDDYIEKADTGATGRALAKIGYGTQFAPEFNEQHRIVDAPVDRAAHGYSGRETTDAITNDLHTNNGTPPATEQQLASLRKLRQYLGKPEPENAENMSYLDAKTTIVALSAEYNESRKQQKAS